MKQTIVVRTDLKMGKGKTSAQVAHASLEAYKKTPEDVRAEWESEGYKKIVLKVSSEKELIDVFNAAKKAKLPVAFIKDAGHTQLAPGTSTCVGIGPAEDMKIDKIVGKLKLL